MGKMTIGQMVAQLASGMLISTQIFVITLLFSLPLGLIVAFGRLSKNRVISMIVKFYISIMRGTPLMLQLMVVYFGPYYLFHIKVGSSYRLTATFIGFVINYAAYFAEIYRSGIQSMPVGQYEAAQILGYNKAQTFFKIILPQVIKRILPSITNEVITLVKDTSLSFHAERCRDVLDREGAGGFPDKHDPVCGSRNLLLCVQPDRGGRYGVDREETGLLPVGWRCSDHESVRIKSCGKII